MRTPTGRGDLLRDVQFQLETAQERVTKFSDKRQQIQQQVNRLQEEVLATANTNAPLEEIRKRSEGIRQSGCERGKRCSIK